MLRTSLNLFLVEFLKVAQEVAKFERSECQKSHQIIVEQNVRYN